MWTTTQPEYTSGVTEDTKVTNISEPLICWELQQFGMFYKRIHGYSSLTVCSFGTMANILNLIVLTRPEMKTPTNLILSGLAFADMLNMVEYIPFVIYTHFLPDPEDGKTRKSWGWALFVLFHSNFSQVCHTIAIWLTITLAIWRYIMVTKPFKSGNLCSMIRAKWAILMAYLISPLLCIPIFCSFSIHPISPRNSSLSSSIGNESVENMFNSTEDLSMSQEEGTKYVVNLSNLAISYPLLKKSNFWFFSVVIKLIPCVILTIVSYQLIMSLRAAKKRKDQLLGGNIRIKMEQRRKQLSFTSISTGESLRETGGFTSKVCATTRTTRMLIAVLVLFLITEFPQGVLALLSDLLSEQFFKVCYMPLSDLMDFVALLNSAINFILYCRMGRQFREVFCRIFWINRFLKRIK